MSGVNYSRGSSFYRRGNVCFAEAGGSGEENRSTVENVGNKGLWMDDEIRILKKLGVKVRPEEIAGQLGRSVAAVRNKIYRMGFNTNKYKSWTEKEVKRLKEEFANKTTRQMAKQLGRSINSVREKGQRMGLKKSKKHLKAIGLL